jgi:hypothetical protein
VAGQVAVEVESPAALHVIRSVWDKRNCECAKLRVLDRFAECVKALGKRSGVSQPFIGWIVDAVRSLPTIAAGVSGRNVVAGGVVELARRDFERPHGIRK